MAEPLLALFLLAHGLVHLAIYAIRPDPSKAAPFNPSRSWALAGRGTTTEVMRRTSTGLAVGTAVAYAAAGSVLLLDAPWIGLGAVAALLGLALKSLWFHPWLTVGVLIDVTVLAAVLTGAAS